VTRHVVEVNEVMVFATGRGLDWWTSFRLAHRTTEVTVTLGGAVCHVASTAASTPAGWPRPWWSTGYPARR